MQIDGIKTITLNIPAERLPQVLGDHLPADWTVRRGQQPGTYYLSERFGIIFATVYAEGMGNERTRLTVVASRQLDPAVARSKLLCSGYRFTMRMFALNIALEIERASRRQSGPELGV